MSFSLAHVVAFAAIIASAAAWTTPVSSPSLWHSRRSSLESVADDSVAEASLDRRHFFRSATAKTAALLVASSATALDDARAAADAAPYSKTYTPAPHSMDGKHVVITGGNTGLGLESAKRLAAAGATVVFTSRDSTKGQDALAEIDDYLKQRTADDAVFAGKAMMASLDLCDLEDVKSFDKRLAKLLGQSKIDVLLNNAGVMAIPDRRLTKDGYEKTFQTNHLGHFALTSTLLPLLASDARVVNVSSMGYLFTPKGGLDLDNLNGETEYGPWSSYGQSKLENILFTNELQRRARESAAHSDLTAFSLHPGAVQTDLARYLIGEEKFRSMKENGFSNWKDQVLMEGLAKFVKTVQEGASTQVFVASADMGPQRAGKYFADGKVVPVQAFATDPAKGAELWAASENLAGVKFDL